VVARFCRLYPGLYHSPQWPTTDGVVPYGLFVLLMRARRHVIAEDRMAMTHAVGIAIRLAMSGADDGATRSLVEQERREAFPGD
jgi:hypothetical protein